MKKKKTAIVSILAVCLILSFIVTLCWGTYKISMGDMIKVLLGKGTKLQNTAVFTIRLPRLLTGIFVAAGLSTAGALLQTVTKNDLADSGVIGINAGAAAGAVLFITYGTSSYYSELGSFSIFVLPFIAILGAAVTAFLIYMLAGRGKVRPKRLLLIGLGLNAGMNAFVTFVGMQAGRGDYNRVLIWTTGSLWGSGWQYARVLGPVIILMFILVMLDHKKLDVLSLSDEMAISLGINLEKERKKFLIYAVILAGTATGFAGNIGFLGLIAPHIARKLTGPYHRQFIPVSAMVSMIIVLIADAMSRNLFSPIELPAGVTISIFGVPYFIYLIMKEK